MPRPKSAQQPRQQQQQASLAKNRATSQEAVFSNWSVDECQKLVDYIKKHGFDGDVKKICGHFPGHTETNIRHFMNELTTRTIKKDPFWTLAGKFETLQEMARSNNLSQSYGSVLPTFVEWMSLFVDHSPPEESDGVDYAEIYRSLAALMRGEIPRELVGRTAAKCASIVEAFFEKLKYRTPQTRLPASFKRPVPSAAKSRQQCNATLASRRSHEWTRSERSKRDLLLVCDLRTVRELYLIPAWANPYRFPDEFSFYRTLKTMPRKMIKNEKMKSELRNEQGLDCPEIKIEPGTVNAIKQEPIDVDEYVAKIMKQELGEEQLSAFNLIKQELIDVKVSDLKTIAKGDEEKQPRKVIKRRRRRRN